VGVRERRRETCLVVTSADERGPLASVPAAWRRLIAFGTNDAVAPETAARVDAHLVRAPAIRRAAAAFVDVRAGAPIVKQLKTRRTAAAERSRRVFADAEAEPAASVLVEPLALVDVDARPAVERFLVAVVAGALKRAPGVDALVLAAVIWQLALVDIAAIATVARGFKARVARARVGTWSVFTNCLRGANSGAIMQAFVEVLALLGVTIDAIAFGADAAIAARFVDAVLIGEAFVTSVLALVNINAIGARLRYLEAWPALNE